MNETVSLISVTLKFIGGEGQIKRGLKQSIKCTSKKLGGHVSREASWRKKCLVWILKHKWEFGRKQRVSENTEQGNSTWFHRTEGKGVYEHILGNGRKIGREMPDWEGPSQLRGVLISLEGYREPWKTLKAGY